ncbi:MAG: hypothetical protein JJE15_15280 [Desulfobacteraceae bacterium]|nr:hypothetical protein [Desulfobacteraceae bacterium]
MRSGVLALFLVMMAALLIIPSAFAKGGGSLNAHGERPTFLQRAEASAADAVASLIPGCYHLGKAQAISNIVVGATQSIDHSHLAKRNGSASVGQSVIDENEAGIFGKNLSADLILGLIPSFKRPWGHRFFLSVLSQGGNPLKAKPKRGRAISFNFKLLEF